MGQYTIAPQTLRALGARPTLPPEALAPFDEANPPQRSRGQEMAGAAFENAIDAFLGSLGIAPTGETKANLLGQLVMAAVPVVGGAKTLKEIGTKGRTLVNGFYSRLDEAAKMLPNKGVSAPGVMNWLKKAPEGISLEEAAYRKLPEFLEAQGQRVVTPEMLAEHLQKHPAPFPQVKKFGAAPVSLVAEQDELAAKASAAFDRAFPSATINGEPWPDQLSQLDEANARHWAWQAAAGDSGAIAKLNQLAISDERRAAMLEYGRLANETRALNDNRLAQYPTPKYARYQVPGGENYRETLLTLPEQPPQALPDGYSIQPLKGDNRGSFTLVGPDGSGSVLSASSAEQAHANALNVLQHRGVLSPPQNFRSSHFEEPNILVHTRANDRTLPSGEPGRFVEEVQSDWHQQGKKKGYGPQTEVTAYYEANGQKIPLGYGKTEEAAAASVDPAWKHLVEIKYEPREVGRGVADAPFKESWPDLGLKQQLIEAAHDPKAEWMGFTAGRTQADRYDLSKQIGEIHYSGTNLKAYGLDGREVISQTGVRPEELPDYIGKEAAEKLMAQPPKGKLRSLTGLELQVGGEGMRKFYDELLPKRLEKIVKPLGGTVEKAPVRLRDLVTRRDETAARLERTRAFYGPTDDTARVLERDLEDLDTQINALRRESPDAVHAESGWITRLTPEMKAAIKRGVPLMSVLGAAVGAGVLSAADAQQIAAKERQ